MAQLLQTNVNHSRHAQDLLMYTVVEGNYELAIVAEPYKIFNNKDWISDDGESVAIFNNKYTKKYQACRLLKRNKGFIICEWQRIIIVGCYISPNVSLSEYEEFLDRMGNDISQFNGQPMLIAGNFSAHSTIWGSRNTNMKSNTVELWTVVLMELLVLTYDY